MTVFLQSHGVGTSRDVRIFKTYGPIPQVTENTYRLARDIRGIGFKRWILQWLSCCL
ncbi:helix-hairpin-helix domain-containing protein [Azospirillum himalayense]|uniref:helix-hairpin-helix domain-containing protein n=1 Tax=Azospirillum himalayense TaxID=654847 RepID=UPI003A945F5F